MTNDGQNGKRVLLAEDFFSLAEMVRGMLENLGYVVIGPVPSVQKAMALMETERFDAALLDISLKDGKVFPLAEELRTRGLPFVFATAYDDDSAIPPGLRSAPRVVKPFSEDDLGTAMSRLFAGASATAPGTPQSS